MARQRCDMRGQIRQLWIAGSIIAASALLSPHPVIASPRMISLAFNSQLQAPQQFGSDEFRRKLLALAGKRIIIDQRGSGALGSENAILAAAQTGAVDFAVISGRGGSTGLPALGVFDIPFMFRDDGDAKGGAQGPVAGRPRAQI